LPGGGFCFSLGRSSDYRPFLLAGLQATRQITPFFRLLTTGEKEGQGCLSQLAKEFKRPASSFPFRPDVPFARDAPPVAYKEQTPAPSAASKILFRG
jgi:hypothetical protein